jgi:2'-hydroxyisoflavone reductase
LSPGLPGDLHAGLRGDGSCLSTGFIGPHFVNALKAGGHTITLFNRGKRDPDADPGIEQLIGDRNGQVDALKGRDWDALIDNSAYTPRQVRLTAELLKGHVQQYILISSVAAYANFAKAGIDEDYELAKLDDPTVEEVNGQTYGGLKALCEKVVEEVYGKQATLIRPTYIAGPATTRIVSLTGRCACRKAVRCWCPARPAIRFRSSMCET